MRIYTDETQGAEHIALIKGDLSGDAPVLVRMHAHGPAARRGRARRPRAGRASSARDGDHRGGRARGAVVLLRDTTMKLASGDAASPQTLRQYGLGAQILSSLGLSRARPPHQFADAEGRGARRLRALHRRHAPHSAGLIMAGQETAHPAAARVPRPGEGADRRCALLQGHRRGAPGRGHGGAGGGGRAWETWRSPGRWRSRPPSARPPDVELRRLRGARLRDPGRDNAITRWSATTARAG